jgi:hypothetical protein
MIRPMKDRNRNARRGSAASAWRKRFAWALALCVGATSLIIAPMAASVQLSPLLPLLSVDITGSVTPSTLPEHTLAPVSLHVQGTISVSEMSHPSALRKATIELEPDVSIDAEGLAACPVRVLRGHDIATARRICRKSIIGSGSARIGIGSSPQPPPQPQPGQTPLSEEAQTTVSSELTLYNGGVANGITTLFAHGYISSPSPASLVMVVKINRKGKGLQAVAKIPSIAEGQGSLLGFRFTLGRYFWREGEKQSYLNAKCPDGDLTVSFLSLLFRNDAREARVPAESSLRGSESVPCTPQAE